jgi:hypothetical protein
MDKRVFCDCGKPLNYTVDKVVHSVKFAITKNGRISKRPIKGTDGKGSKGESLNFGCFICSDRECGKQYEYNGIVGGQVLRGDLL